MCASPEVLVPFSVPQPYRDAWSVPRSRLSRFDVPCHNINQPASTVPGKLSLRFYLSPSGQSGLYGPAGSCHIPATLMGFCPSQYCSCRQIAVVSSGLYPHAVNYLTPSINFRRGVDRHVLLTPQLVARRSTTARFVRLLGLTLPTVRTEVECSPPSADPALDLASFRVCGCIGSHVLSGLFPITNRQSPGSRFRPQSAHGFTAGRPDVLLAQSAIPDSPSPPPTLQRFDETDA